MKKLVDVNVIYKPLWLSSRAAALPAGRSGRQRRNVAI